MLQVLDGIIAPNFNPALHRRRVEEMQERMTQATDSLLQKSRGSYRKSDDALLDEAKFGPVYF